MSFFKGPDIFNFLKQIIFEDFIWEVSFYKIENFLKFPDFSQAANLKTDQSKKVLQLGLSHLKTALDAKTPVDEGLKKSIQAAGKELGLKGKDLYFPFRLAITGSEAGPELVPLAKVLGEAEVLKRIESESQVLLNLYSYS